MYHEQLIIKKELLSIFKSALKSKAREPLGLNQGLNLDFVGLANYCVTRTREQNSSYNEDKTFL